jgi:hypothetical protein
MIISYLGVYKYAPLYLTQLNKGINTFVCMFLIYRFNPFTYDNQSFSELDVDIAFTAGIFMLASTWLQSYINEVKRKFKQDTKLEYWTATEKKK